MDALYFFFTHSARYTIRYSTINEKNYYNSSIKIIPHLKYIKNTININEIFQRIYQS